LNAMMAGRAFMREFRYALADELRIAGSCAFSVEALPKLVANAAANAAARVGRQRAPATAAGGEWVRPPGWRLPKNGTWEGTPGHSNFKPTNPAELGLNPGEVVPFRNGRPDFSNWSKGNYTSGKKLVGDHGLDQQAMKESLAKSKGWTVRQTEDWLRDNQYVLHHSGGDNFQLLDAKLHGAGAWGENGIRHMGGAFDLRNK
jgi:hypothetical protein